MKADVPLIRLEGLTKRFGGTAAVDRVSLDIRAGELFSLLGASGSGKTTLLRLLGGFETPSEGRVLIDGADVTAMPPYERPTNMVFQSYALFPHMSVESNVAFGLAQGRGKGRVTRAERRRRVAEALELVRLSDFASRRPDQLSGGQRQRVALARALVLRPKVLLLDEPLSALDKKLREHTQFELMRLQRALSITFVMVTHDQDEALAMSTRLAVMDCGRVVETGTPREVYERPQSCFVADFIGGANIFEVRCAGPGRLLAPELGVEIEAHGTPNGRAPEGPAWIALRPERVGVRRAASGERGAPAGVVEAVAFHGDVSFYRITLDCWRAIRAATPSAKEGLGAGDRVLLSWPADAPVLLLR